MFKIEFYIDDKSLSKALWTLETVGGIYDVKTVPVRNATTHKRVRAVRNGSIRDMVPDLVEHLSKVDGPLAATHVRDFIVSQGYSPKSYSLLLKLAKDVGALHPIPGLGTSQQLYTLTPTTKRAASKKRTKKKAPSKTPPKEDASNG
jgi:hypothetical protein